MRDLRLEDCRAANARRAEVRDAILGLLDNDRYLIELADSVTPDGLPTVFKAPLLARYNAQEDAIREAYRIEPCPS